MSRRLPFLLPYVRIELLIRTMLTERWAPEAWPAWVCEGAQAAQSHCAGWLVELNAWDERVTRDVSERGYSMRCSANTAVSMPQAWQRACGCRSSWS